MTTSPRTTSASLAERRENCDRLMPLWLINFYC
jgi:hypothetical protein